MNTLLAITEKASYEIMRKDYPQVVQGIRTLLSANESPKRIIAEIKRSLPKSLTTTLVENTVHFLARERGQS
jgi:hypothetical protein